MYADITWGAGGTTSDATMDIAISMRKVCCGCRRVLSKVGWFCCWV
jgi:hypothetical protein